MNKEYQYQKNSSKINKSVLDKKKETTIMKTFYLILFRHYFF